MYIDQTPTRRIGQRGSRHLARHFLRPPGPSSRCQAPLHCSGLGAGASLIFPSTSTADRILWQSGVKRGDGPEMVVVDFGQHGRN